MSMKSEKQMTQALTHINNKRYDMEKRITDAIDDAITKHRFTRAHLTHNSPVQCIAV